MINAPGSWTKCIVVIKPIIKVVFSVGWSTTPFVIADFDTFLYQESTTVGTNDILNYYADFTNASAGRYLSLKYPKTATRFSKWQNLQGDNKGTIPDQVFRMYEDDTYYYIYSVVKPALDPNKRIITFS